jgi:hypothetical protein
MNVCPRFFCGCVVLCRQRPCDRADNPAKESYRLSIRSIFPDYFRWENKPEGLIRRIKEEEEEADPGKTITLELPVYIKFKRSLVPMTPTMNS